MSILIIARIITKSPRLISTFLTLSVQCAHLVWVFCNKFAAEIRKNGEIHTNVEEKVYVRFRASSPCTAHFRARCPNYVCIVVGRANIDAILKLWFDLSIIDCRTVLHVSCSSWTIPTIAGLLSILKLQLAKRYAVCSR